jgi:hypothetical protein
MQPWSGRLTFARLPPCSPGCRPDLPRYRRRLTARRAGLPPRPARAPAPKSPADAQLPPPETASQPQAWMCCNHPALVDAALRKRAAPRACIRGTSPALVVAALRERAASRACIPSALADAALQVRAAPRASWGCRPTPRPDRHSQTRRSRCAPLLVPRGAAAPHPACIGAREAPASWGCHPTPRPDRRRITGARSRRAPQTRGFSRLLHRGLTGARTRRAPGARGFSRLHRGPTAATSPALVVAALRERAASRACIQAHQPALAEAALQVRAASRACLCGTASTARGGTRDKGNKPRAQAGAPESRRANGSGASAPKGASHRKRGGARSLVPARLKAVLRLLASWWAALRA